MQVPYNVMIMLEGIKLIPQPHLENGLKEIDQLLIEFLPKTHGNEIRTFEFSQQTLNFLGIALSVSMVMLHNYLNEKVN